MGTYYIVEVVEPHLQDDVLRELCEAELREVNAQMSTWLPDSDLSRFNRSPPGAWFAVPAAVVQVVDLAREISELTSGAFDVTVGSLVDAWNFGPAGDDATKIPRPVDIESLRRKVDYKRLQFRRMPPALRKEADFQVDLSAIAKGYAVDVLGSSFRQRGWRNFLIEIGGEVRVAGTSPGGGPWRVGVERPDPGGYGRVHRVLPLSDIAVATSGDYRNFFTVDGRKFSHLIDPKSGQPIDQPLVSVTVLADSAARADALATAFHVLDYSRGRGLAEQHGIAVLFIIREDSGLSEYMTSAFKRILEAVHD